jgi:hypothetical protein
MKRLIHCNDCNYYEIYLGWADVCPKCNSTKIEIEIEGSNERLDDDGQDNSNFNDIGDSISMDNNHL